MKLILDISRIRAAAENGCRTSNTSASATAAKVVAPRALPVEASATPLNDSGGRERHPRRHHCRWSRTRPKATAVGDCRLNRRIRRAEPVHPEDLARVGLSPSPSAPANSMKHLEVAASEKNFSSEWWWKKTDDDKRTSNGSGPAIGRYYSKASASMCTR